MGRGPGSRGPGRAGRGAWNAGPERPTLFGPGKIGAQWTSLGAHTRPRARSRRRPQQPKPPMPRRALPLVLLLSLACASTREERGGVDRIDELVARQRYEEAVRAADELRERRPEDPEVAEAHRRASVAYLLERARRATFGDDPEQALDWVGQAAEIGPDFPAVEVWIAKTNRTLARRWLERGLDLHAQGNLDGATLAYQRALLYDPNSMPVARSLAQASLQLDYRAELGQDYYHEGVNSLAAFWLERARSRFSYAGKYLEDERPRTRGKEVDRLLAEQRLAVARELERKELYSAAATEYRLGLRLDPQLEGAREGLERARREAAWKVRLLESEMDMRRGEYERALERLDQGGERTELQAERVAALGARIEEARLDQIYQRARDLERDFRYEEAIAGYDALLTQVDFHRDARTRRDTLAGYVREAARLWELALAAADDPDQQRMLLLQIEVFWPEYRDLRERLAALGRRDEP